METLLDHDILNNFSLSHILEDTDTENINDISNIFAYDYYSLDMFTEHINKYNVKVS